MTLREFVASDSYATSLDFEAIAFRGRGHSIG